MTQYHPLACGLPFWCVQFSDLNDFMDGFHHCHIWFLEPGVTMFVQALAATLVSAVHLESNFCLWKIDLQLTKTKCPYQKNWIADSQTEYSVNLSLNELLKQEILTATEMESALYHDWQKTKFEKIYGQKRIMVIPPTELRESNKLLLKTQYYNM